MLKPRQRAALGALLALAWAAPSAAAELKLLSLNAAGSRLTNGAQRLEALGQALESGGYDAVGIQGAWRDEDASLLAQRSRLPRQARFESRLSVGTGLAMLTRLPILKTAQELFTMRPSPLRWPRGQPAADNGVLLARLKTGAGPLDVYDAHLLSDDPGARYSTLRAAQIFETAAFIEKSSGNAPFILMGEFNAGPGDGEYQLLIDLLGLEDACLGPGAGACGRIFVPAPGGRYIAGRSGSAAGVEATLDLRLLRIKPRRDAAKRVAALKKVEQAMARMTDALLRRQRARGWIPVYGLMLTLSDERQLAQLWSVRSRAETTRIKAQAKR